MSNNLYRPRAILRTKPKEERKQDQFPAALQCGQTLKITQGWENVVDIVHSLFLTNREIATTQGLSRAKVSRSGGSLDVLLVQAG